MMLADVGESECWALFLTLAANVVPKYLCLRLWHWPLVV